MWKICKLWARVSVGRRLMGLGEIIKGHFKQINLLQHSLRMRRGRQTTGNGNSVWLAITLTIYKDMQSVDVEEEENILYTTKSHYDWLPLRKFRQEEKKMVRLIDREFNYRQYGNGTTLSDWLRGPLELNAKLNNKQGSLANWVIKKNTTKRLIQFLRLNTSFVRISITFNVII